MSGAQRVRRLWSERRLRELVEVRPQGPGGLAKDFDFLLIVMKSHGRVYSSGIHSEHRAKSRSAWKQAVQLGGRKTVVQEKDGGNLD